MPVYYINLERSVEKNDAMYAMLKQLGFKNINRFPGIEREVKREGVALSHNAILNELKNEKTPFIIFEDDIAPKNFVSKFAVPEDIDALYLGNSIYGLYSGRGQKKISAEKYNEDLYRIYNMLAAHAIVYFNNDYVKFLAKATEYSLAALTNQDKVRAETMKYWNIYARNNPMFIQGGAHFEPTKTTLDEAKKTDKTGAH